VLLSGQTRPLRLQVEAAQIMRIKDNLVRMYAQMTGQTQDQILEDLDRDNFM
jgi:ATP-dependent protease ClpP protease subunit